MAKAKSTKKRPAKRPKESVATKPSPIGQFGNKYAIGNNGGRPPMFKSAEDLAKKVDEYFVYCEGEFHIEKQNKLNPKTGEMDSVEVKVWDRYPEPYTVTGLTLYLGFAHRQSLDDYEEKSEYTDIIKRARSRVEHGYEKRLFADRPTGAIFALSNMGWKNSHQVDHTSKGERIGAQTLDNFSDDDLLKLAELKAKSSGR